MFKKLKENLLDLFFPPHCVACNALGTLLCDSCEEKIAIYEKGYHLSFQPGSALSGIIAVGHFRDEILKDMIHKYKYEGISALSLVFAEMMTRRIKEEGIDFDYLAYVPITRKRERWRGYNQAELLTHALGRNLKRPILPGLHKVKETKTQVGLLKKEREKNLKSAFLYQGKRLNGKKILLIDDVTTTGTTLNECAKILRKKGANEVIGAVIAKE